jgi:hypothetical protein
VVEPDTGIAFCPAGNLDGELSIQPQGHRFVGSKGTRNSIAERLPQHEEV